MAKQRDYTLLLVEDNELNLEMLKRRLEKQGFRVLVARAGDQVQGVLLQSRPDAILMDLSMPGIDGWTLAGLLKANPGFASIPLIAVTAHAMRGDRDKALQAGFDAYVTKPVDFKYLLKIIYGQLAHT